MKMGTYILILVKQCLILIKFNFMRVLGLNVRYNQMKVQFNPSTRIKI